MVGPYGETNISAGGVANSTILADYGASYVHGGGSRTIA